MNSDAVEQLADADLYLNSWEAGGLAAWAQLFVQILRLGMVLSTLG